MSIKLILIILLSFTFWDAESQIVLTFSDLPKPGDIQTTARIDSIEELSLAPGNSGANIIWDFGQLNFYNGSLDFATDSERWVHPNETNFQTFFPQANIAQKTNCYWWHDMTTHTLKEQCYFNFYISDSTGLYLYGSNYPYNNILPKYRNIFPLLKYGDSLKQTSKSVYSISSDSTFVRTVKDTTIADSWGNIYTPIDSYQAIRMYTKETVWDSLYINGIGQQIKFQGDNYYYRWYAKNMGFPVMQISKGILEKQSNFKIVRVAVGLRTNSIHTNISEEQNNLQIYPNPFSETARIQFNKTYNKQEVSVYIYDHIGKELFITEKLKISDLIITKGNLSNGFYLYKIVGENGIITCGKFIIN